MFRNYCKIAIRNLLKNRTFSIINLTGLSLSIAFCLLLFFYIRYEQSYDTFHAKKNRLFRLESTNPYGERNAPQKGFLSFLHKNEEGNHEVNFPLIAGPGIQNDFPEIKSLTRIKQVNLHWGEQLIRVNNEIFKEKNVLYADDNFLSNFSFPLLKGNTRTALTSPANVILSESVARKYFGTSEVIGKKIEILTDSLRLLTVAGIAKDAPSNSSLQFSIVLPLTADPGYKENIRQGFNKNEHFIIVELADDVAEARFQQKLNKWAKTFFTDYFKLYQITDTKNFNLYLRPLADCHYYKGADWGHYTNIQNIYALAVLAAIILLIASLNYILLAVSNIASRTREVGVRKVMGANKRAVIIQFWTETQILIIAAVFAGLLIAKFCTPYFNNLMEIKIDFSALSFKDISVALATIAFILGILAGYYPAWLLSRLKPVSIVKSSQTFKIKPSFARSLVVIQFTAGLVLMISALIISTQMQYVNNKSLGFDKEQVLMVNNPLLGDVANSKTVYNRLETFSNTQPSISSFSAMTGGLDGANNTSGFQLNGEQKWRKRISVGYNYFEMMGLKLIEGRPFSQKFATDSSKVISSVVINESLFKLLGKTAKIGEYNEPIHAKIIGVVKDYNFESLANKIEPEEHAFINNFFTTFLFKIRPGEIKHALASIEKEWKDATGNYPFEYTFLDQSIAKMYAQEMRWENIIRASCFFAIFIACMGLFGLSAINAVNRTKEIGIRKVLGASVKDIVTTLSTSFVVMIAIAILIATPIAWWIMNKWLEDFAYRIHVSWWMFIVTGFAALLIALATVSYHAIKTAKANPVKSLRAE